MLPTQQVYFSSKEQIRLGNPKGNAVRPPRAPCERSSLGLWGGKRVSFRGQAGSAHHHTWSLKTSSCCLPQQPSCRCASPWARNPALTLLGLTSTALLEMPACGEGEVPFSGFTAVNTTTTPCPELCSCLLAGLSVPTFTPLPSTFLKNWR